MRGIKSKFQFNEKFWRLTAIKDLNKSVKTARGTKKSVWLFKCDCGREIEAIVCDVKYGKKKSCGCLQKEYRKNCGNRLRPLITKPNKGGPITKLFGNYKRQAERRGYEWSISKDLFEILISQKCYYCGANPQSKISVARIITPENTLIYNGIDRKDNNVGYTEENCITACGVCNRMKMDLDFNTFINLINTIYRNICASGFMPGVLIHTTKDTPI